MPKKKPEKAIQNTIWVGPSAFGPRASKAPERNSTVIIAVTSTGDPMRTASVRRFLAMTSALRRLRRSHWRNGRTVSGGSVVGADDNTGGSVTRWDHSGGPDWLAMAR